MSEKKIEYDMRSKKFHYNADIYGKKIISTSSGKRTPIDINEDIVFRRLKPKLQPISIHMKDELSDIHIEIPNITNPNIDKIPCVGFEKDPSKIHQHSNIVTSSKPPCILKRPIQKNIIDLEKQKHPTITTMPIIPSIISSKAAAPFKLKRPGIPIFRTDQYVTNILPSFDKTENLIDFDFESPKTEIESEISKINQLKLYPKTITYDPVYDHLGLKNYDKVAEFLIKKFNNMGIISDITTKENFNIYCFIKRLIETKTIDDIIPLFIDNEILFEIDEYMFNVAWYIVMNSLNLSEKLINEKIDEYIKIIKFIKDDNFIGFEEYMEKTNINDFTSIFTKLSELDNSNFIKYLLENNLFNDEIYDVSFLQNISLLKSALNSGKIIKNISNNLLTGDFTIDEYKKLLIGDFDRNYVIKNEIVETLMDSEKFDHADALIIKMGPKYFIRYLMLLINYDNRLSIVSLLQDETFKDIKISLETYIELVKIRCSDAARNHLTEETLGRYTSNDTEWGYICKWRKDNIEDAKFIDEVFDCLYEYIMINITDDVDDLFYQYITKIDILFDKSIKDIELILRNSRGNTGIECDVIGKIYELYRKERPCYNNGKYANINTPFSSSICIIHPKLLLKINDHDKIYAFSLIDFALLYGEEMNYNLSTIAETIKHRQILNPVTGNYISYDLKLEIKTKIKENINLIGSSIRLDDLLDKYTHENGPDMRGLICIFAIYGNFIGDIIKYFDRIEMIKEFDDIINLKSFNKLSDNDKEKITSKLNSFRFIEYEILIKELTLFLNMITVPGFLTGYEVGNQIVAELGNNIKKKYTE